MRVYEMKKIRLSCETAVFQLVEKVCFFKKVLVLNPYPQTPFPRERLCMLGWLCIVQSLGAYTPGIRAGAECGATAPRPCRGLRPCDPIFINDRGLSTV